MKDENKDVNYPNNLTKYGENVCTQFAWLPLDKQKENAERFAKITKNENKSEK